MLQMKRPIVIVNNDVLSQISFTFCHIIKHGQGRVSRNPLSSKKLPKPPPVRRSLTPTHRRAKRYLKIYDRSIFNTFTLIMNAENYS